MMESKQGKHWVTFDIAEIQLRLVIIMDPMLQIILITPNIVSY